MSTLPVTLIILAHVLGGGKADFLEPFFELDENATINAFESEMVGTYLTLTFPEDVVDEVAVDTLVGMLLVDGDGEFWHKMAQKGKKGTKWHKMCFLGTKCKKVKVANFLLSSFYFRHGSSGRLHGAVRVP